MNAAEKSKTENKLHLTAEGVLLVCLLKQLRLIGILSESEGQLLTGMFIEECKKGDLSIDDYGPLASAMIFDAGLQKLMLARYGGGP